MSSDITYYEDVVDAPRVRFIFPDGTKKSYPIGYRVRGLRHGNARPIGIEWDDNAKDYIPSAQDIEWMYEELRYVFDMSVNFEDAIRRIAA